VGFRRDVRRTAERFTPGWAKIALVLQFMVGAAGVARLFDDSALWRYAGTVMILTAAYLIVFYVAVIRAQRQRESS
jgi:hypothetical protein